MVDSRGNQYELYSGLDAPGGAPAGYHRLQQLNGQPSLQADCGIPQQRAFFPPANGNFPLGFSLGCSAPPLRDRSAADVKPIVVEPQRRGALYHVTPSTYGLGMQGYRPLGDRVSSCSPPYEALGVAAPSVWSAEPEKRRPPRSERKPIPSEQKDEKYFERRHRNNDAAKRSRDARKQRVDAIVQRSNVLEHENLVLRAKRSTLYDQLCAIREMAIKRGKRLEFGGGGGGGTGAGGGGGSAGGELKML